MKTITRVNCSMSSSWLTETNRSAWSRNKMWCEIFFEENNGRNVWSDIFGNFCWSYCWFEQRAWSEIFHV